MQRPAIDPGGMHLHEDLVVGDCGGSDIPDRYHRVRPSVLLPLDSSHRARHGASAASDHRAVAGDCDPATHHTGPVEQIEFTAELWLWDARREDTWVFVTVPEQVGEAIDDHARAAGPRAGFGSVKVEVRIGGTTWLTSVFPDKASGCFVLPVKRSVREANGVQPGDTVIVAVRTVG